MLKYQDTILVLRKPNGVTAIQGNVFVNRGGHLDFDTSHQLARSSVVTLNEGELYLGNWGGDITQSFKQLIVDNSGVLYFEGDDGSSSIHKLYLDDLLIHASGELIFKRWKEGRDFILVKKTSENVEDALKKMKFEGYDPSKIQLADYNNEYWEVKGAPEPATYGAGLMLGVLGLVRYRRRQNSLR
ncbi:hypothetical protein AXK12_02905 [Cephaloticoccus capnophilus]|uniref:PEP-CTERM protein-sorting domain-containing protein n=1 Tax=Cephaloticoccus capnophilus TaxID=1548208 RepID=A0A139SQI8_9BACT|nr:hypothetical protein [Cephaloticoccus capnophilus]KXU36721.1 hypothetical protein AXK12_02905 [Cephaloticoccus capnophilus]